MPDPTAIQQRGCCLLSLAHRTPVPLPEAGEPRNVLRSGEAFQRDYVHVSA